MRGVRWYRCAPALLVFLGAGEAAARTWTVDRDDHLAFNTISEVLQNFLLADGDRIEVFNGPYEEYLDLGDKQITLIAPEGRVTISPPALVPTTMTMVAVGGGQTSATVIQNFLVEGTGDPSYPTHGIVCDGTGPRVVDCVFQDHAGVDGAGASCLNGSTARFEGCQFLNNIAPTKGGGLLLAASPVLLDNCQIRGNAAGDRGAGVCIEAVSGMEGSVEMRSCRVDFNGAGTNRVGRHGGGVYVDGDGTVGLRAIGCDFVTNVTVSDLLTTAGAGVRVENAEAVFSRCDFKDNHRLSNLFVETGSGGALSIVGGETELIRCRFTDGNTAVTGGALSIEGGTHSASGCTFADNEALSEGGAIAVLDGTLDISESQFLSNRSSDGGAVHAINSTVELTNCLFKWNSADLAGGSIHSDGSLVLAGCAIASSRAEIGAALFLIAGSTEI
jgi:hypothetical protein